MFLSERAGSHRGVALGLVLLVVTVLFILAVAVAGMSSSNAKMVLEQQDGIRAREAALAGQAFAQAALNPVADWTQPIPGLTASPVEHALSVPGTVSAPADTTLLSSNPAVWYEASLVDTPTASRVTVRSSGYLKNPDGSHRATVVITTRYQRAQGALLYPVQASDGVSINGSAVGTVDDVAIRTDATASASVSLVSATVTGDVLVGPTQSVSGVVNPAPPSPTEVSSAPARAAFQPVVAPSVAPGVMQTPTAGTQGGSTL